jgi:hypothetical protein
MNTVRMIDIKSQGVSYSIGGKAAAGVQLRPQSKADYEFYSEPATNTTKLLLHERLYI